MDLLEFFLLNHPAPSETVKTPPRKKGEELFSALGCVECHVSDWQLNAEQRGHADYTQRFSGDRRSFNLSVVADAKSDDLRGRLEH